MGTALSKGSKSVNKADKNPYSVMLRFWREKANTENYITYLCWWSEQKLNILLTDIIIMKVYVQRFPLSNEWMIATHLLCDKDIYAL